MCTREYASSLMEHRVHVRQIELANCTNTQTVNANVTREIASVFSSFAALFKFKPFVDVCTLSTINQFTNSACVRIMS